MRAYAACYWLAPPPSLQGEEPACRRRRGDAWIAPTPGGLQHLTARVCRARRPKWRRLVRVERLVMVTRLLFRICATARTHAAPAVEATGEAGAAPVPP